MPERPTVEPLGSLCFVGIWFRGAGCCLMVLVEEKVVERLWWWDGRGWNEPGDWGISMGGTKMLVLDF